MEIKDLVIDLAANPTDPEKNFALAEAYEAISQYASAGGFYLRAAEYGYKTHPLITYTSLLKMSLCWARQNDRKATVFNNVYQAIAYLPGRPEAYFILSRLYERNQEWQKCFTFAELGLQFLPATHNQPLPGYVEYNGPYCLLFEKAVSGWWIGRKDESKVLFQTLLDEYDMAPEYVNGCLNNLRLF